VRQNFQENYPSWLSLVILKKFVCMRKISR
jgi:hypothetical protein